MKKVPLIIGAVLLLCWLIGGPGVAAIWLGGVALAASLSCARWINLTGLSRRNIRNVLWTLSLWCLAAALALGSSMLPQAGPATPIISPSYYCVLVC